jgi:hypothetical protein
VYPFPSPSCPAQLYNPKSCLLQEPKRHLPPLTLTRFRYASHPLPPEVQQSTSFRAPKTSAFLLSQLSQPTISIHWNGTLDVFTTYLSWLATHTLSPSSPTTRSDYTILICVWGMGQILQDPVYQYTALSTILDGLHHWKGQGTPPFIYALTSQLV